MPGQRRLQFYQADVFTDEPFGGNPVAVFPDADGLTDEELQRIAREMNLSETVFVFPPTDPAAVVEATALNTTPTKWNVGMDFNAPERKLLGGFTIRHVTGYNFRSGINAGIIPTFETLDLTVARKLPSVGAQINVSLQNIIACSNGSYELRQGLTSPGAYVPKRSCNIGQRHLEMINMPSIGTMLFVGVRYDR